MWIDSIKYSESYKAYVILYQSFLRPYRNFLSDKKLRVLLQKGSYPDKKLRVFIAFLHLEIFAIEAAEI